jgi:hypothetical protein
VVLEVGAGWFGYWLDRMDAVDASGAGRGVPLKRKPSFYCKRNVWISADPDQHIPPAIVEFMGAEKFFWASDFPHPDHTGDCIKEVEEPGRQADALGAPQSTGRQCHARVQLHPVSQGWRRDRSLDLGFRSPKNRRQACL